MKNWLATGALMISTMTGGCGGGGTEAGDVPGSAAADAAQEPSSTDAHTADPGNDPSATVANDGGPTPAPTLDASVLRDAGPLGVALTDPTSAPSPSVSDVIETVGFDQSTGGFPIPVLLFQGGYASFNVDQIVTPIDIGYDVVEHPSAWPAWRRAATGVELEYASAWTPLMYTYECLALPKGTTLAGTFERRDDTVIGSEAAVETIERYRFAADGTFETCKSTKTAVVALGEVNTAHQSLHGSYEVDGYKIRFTYSDGTSSTQPFFYDPMRPTRLWVERSHFPNPSSVNTAICVDP